MNRDEWYARSSDSGSAPQGGDGVAGSVRSSAERPEGHRPTSSASSASPLRVEQADHDAAAEWAKHHNYPVNMERLVQAFARHRLTSTTTKPREDEVEWLAGEFLAQQAESDGAPIAAEQYRNGKAREIGDGKLFLAQRAIAFALEAMSPRIDGELVEALKACGSALDDFVKLCGPRRKDGSYRCGGIISGELAQEAMRANNVAAEILARIGDRS